MAQNKKNNFALGEILTGLIGNFIKKIETDIVHDVKTKAKEIFDQIKRKTAGTILLMLGLIFLLVGVALFLENFLIIKGLGYLLVGVIIFLVGLFINIKK
jgi:hypothetical protein